MKKILSVVLLLATVLCGCDRGIVTPNNSASSEITAGEIESFSGGAESAVSETESPGLIHDGHPPTPDLSGFLQSEKTYNLESLGYHVGNFAQSESKYYYIDFHNLYSIDKKSGKRTELANTDLIMYHGENKVYIYESDEVLLTLDLKTDKITKTNVKTCFGENLFKPSIFEAPNGFVIVDDYEGGIYFVDAEFKSKTLIKIPDCNDIAFILDNEIFYLGKDYQVCKYDLDTHKVTQITDYKTTIKGDGITSDLLEYLGGGMALVYGDDNLRILDLASGKMRAPYSQYSVNRYMKRVEATYDEDTIHIVIWETVDILVTQMDRETGKRKGMYREMLRDIYKDDWKDVLNLVGIDDEYLYFEDLSSFEKGNHFRIKRGTTVGTEVKEKLFSHMGEEIYIA